MPSRYSTDFDDRPFDEGSLESAPQRVDIGRLLRLRWPLMLGLFFGLAIPLSAAVWLLTPIEYSASADFRFLSTAPRVMNAEQSRFMTAAYKNFVNTQVGLIQGNTVLGRVLDQQQISSLPAIVKSGDRLTYLGDSISVRVERSSELVRVVCTMPDADTAKTVLDEIIEQYLAYAATEESSTNTDRLGPLHGERDTLHAELERLVSRVAERQRDVDSALQSGEGEAELYRENLIAAQSMVNRILREIGEAESFLERIAELELLVAEEPERPIYEFNIESRALADAAVDGLRRSLVSAEANLTDLQQRMLEGNPRRVAEEGRVNSMRSKFDEQIQTARLVVLYALHAEQVQFVKNQQNRVQDARRDIERFEDLLVDYNQRAEEVASYRAEMKELAYKADYTRKRLANVQNEITKISLESNAPGRVRLTSPALRPESPDYGRRFRFIAVAIVLSIGFAGAAGLFRELTDQHIRSSQDIARLTRSPIIATIPHAGEDQVVAGAHLPLLSAHHPGSTTADEFRRLLVRLIYPENNSAEIKSLLVTSPTRGDGKTSVASNLSIALAQAHRRVLLLDVSSRRPEIEKSFSLEPGPGLLEILNGERDPVEVTRTTTVQHLHVLGPGLAPEKLGGRLASREMLQILEWAENEFDHVIIDSPPALLISDARLVAPVVDGCIIVVGVGISTTGMVRRCLREIEQVGANISGIVLNGQRMVRGGYMRHNLDMYYRYAEVEPGTTYPDAASTNNGRNRPVDGDAAIVLLPVEDHDGTDDSDIG